LKKTKLGRKKLVTTSRRERVKAKRQEETKKRMTAIHAKNERAYEALKSALSQSTGENAVKSGMAGIVNCVETQLDSDHMPYTRDRATALRHFFQLQ
jgi:fatty acid-binding protein DegV